MRLRPLLCALLLAPAPAALAQLPVVTEFPLLRSWAAGAELDATPKAPPPGTEEERLTRGKEIYGPLCVRCHGHDSRGGGAGGYGMEPRPANLVDHPVRFRTTPAGAKPTELDLFRTITRGIHGTGMPAYADLPESDRWALATYVRSIQPGADAKPIEIPEAPADLDTKPRIARGAKHFAAQGCAACHTGAAAPNLATRTPKRSRAPGELYATLRLGLPGTAMPPRELPAGELWDLVAYVRSILPAPGSGGMNVQEQEGMTQVIDSCANDI